MGIDQEVSVRALRDDDFAACAANVSVDVEGFLKVVDGGGAGHRTGVEQNTYVGLQYWTEGVEELAMRVNFLLVVLFEGEEDLDRDDTLLSAFDFHRRRCRYCESVRHR